MQYSDASYQKIIEATRSFNPKQRSSELESLSRNMRTTMTIKDAEGIDRMIYTLSKEEMKVYHDQVSEAKRHCNYCVGLF